VHVFLISVASVALGELGDKTQLLALLLATRLRRPLPIIAGIFVATLLNHLLACLLGQWAGTLLTPHILQFVLGVSFLAVAAWALWPDKMEAQPETRSAYGVFTLTALTFFVAEIGDKTEIVALGLAAKYHDVLIVLAGSTLGMMLVNIPTVLFAERAARWVSIRWARIAAALIYAGLGIMTLIEFFRG
jgi:putative Ca2+/H+ antiporter (TMEM165/GDT1 family)